LLLQKLESVIQHRRAKRMDDSMKDDGDKRRTTSLRIAMIGVAPACIMGVCIMVLHSAPWSMPLTNLAATFLGFITVGFGSSVLVLLGSQRPAATAIMVFICMAATMASSGIDGVHRWLALGPIRLHPAAIGAPLLLFTVVNLWQRQKTWFAISILATSFAIHVAQPDAGQATALAAATMALVAFSDKRYFARLVMVIGSLLGATWAWLRPDPLLPVSMVEDIVPRAFAMSVWLGVGATVALAMLPAAAIWHARRAQTNGLGCVYGHALTAYFLANLVVVFIGEFPTPVLGYGASPIWGAILGLGLLGSTAQADEGR